MMTLEAAFSYLLVLAAISMLALSSGAMHADTSVQEHAQLQDALEAMQKTGALEDFAAYAGGDALAGGEADAALARILSLTGKCVSLEANGREKSSCPSAPASGADVMATERPLATRNSGTVPLKAKIWKN